MIIAALLVMVATVYILFDYQRDNRERLVRAQGLDLVRLLSGMSWSELVPSPGAKSALELLRQGQSNPDFAYGAVVTIDGQITTEVTRSGVIVPVAASRLPRHSSTMFDLTATGRPSRSWSFLRFLPLSRCSTPLARRPCR